MQAVAAGQLHLTHSFWFLISQKLVGSQRSCRRAGPFWGSNGGLAVNGYGRCSAAGCVCVCVLQLRFAISRGVCKPSKCLRLRQVVSGGSGTSVCYLPCSPNLNVQVTKNTIVNLSHQGTRREIFLDIFEAVLTDVRISLILNCVELS